MKNSSASLTGIMTKFVSPYIRVITALFIVLAVLYPAVYGLNKESIICSLIYLIGSVCLLLLKTLFNPQRRQSRRRLSQTGSFVHKNRNSE